MSIELSARQRRRQSKRENDIRSQELSVLRATQRRRRRVRNRVLVIAAVVVALALVAGIVWVALGDPGIRL